jgi:glycerol-3-phosphate dehydrogenase
MYDVIIIGSGVIGAAVARELSKYDLKVAVLEKSSDAANGGSTKANSGIVHAGYDAKEGSLKAKLNVLGNKMYDELCSQMDVKFKRNGSLVIAFDDEEVKEVKKLYERGIKNGVEGLEIWDRERILKEEPNINKTVISALYAPTAGIVSPFEFAIALSEVANSNGVEFKFNTCVKNIYKENDIFVIETNNGIYNSKFIVNAAGIHSDEINDMLHGEKFKILPRRGEYCLYDKVCGDLVNMTIFQTPTEKGKGILVSPTIHGNMFVGPNAVDIDEREDVSTTQDGLDEVLQGAKKSVSSISSRNIITSFTGIRSRTDKDDFIINVPERGAVNAAGIESPGLSSSPAIAVMVLQLLKKEGLSLVKNNNFNPYRKNTKLFLEMNEEEREAALKTNPSYGRIICRCESITEGDIINAIKRPIGAKTIDGVKKRVRAGMGRCQGGFCMPRVLDILSRELGIPKEAVEKSDVGSFILTGKTK